MSMSHYEYQNIASPEQCVDLAFEKVLAKTDASREQHDNFVQTINKHGNKWNSKFFLRGSKKGIYDVTLSALKRCQNSPYGYRDLAIQSHQDILPTVSLLYFHKTGAHSFTIWRCQEEYFMISYEESMKFSNGDLENKRVTREYLSYYDEQAHLLDAICNKGVKLNCSLCNNQWEIGACSNLEVTEKNGIIHVYFFCPNCKVAQLNAVKI